MPPPRGFAAGGGPSYPRINLAAQPTASSALPPPVLDSSHRRRADFPPRASAITGILPDTERGKAMSDFDRNIASARGYGADRAVAVDAGLRAYMIRVYNTMAMGVALTGIVSWFTYNAAVVTDTAGRVVSLTSFGQAIFSGPATIVLFLATLGLVFFMSFRVHTLNVGTATGLFFLYAGLLGLMLASVFLVYTGQSIA